MKELIKVDRNGTKYWRQEVACDRCGGHGYYAIAVCNGAPVLSPHDGGMCWKCMGSGKVVEVVKEYTPEHAAKLEARRAAKQAKLEAERKQHEAEIAEARAKREAEEAQRRAEEEAERIRRAGAYIGEVGQKIKQRVTFERQVSFDTTYGLMTIYTMKDANGNTLVWKTGSGSLMNKAGEIPENGDEIEIQGTIKDHNEYNGIKQTVLIRVKRLG